MVEGGKGQNLAFKGQTDARITSEREKKRKWDLKELLDAQSIFLAFNREEKKAKNESRPTLLQCKASMAENGINPN